MARNVPDSSAVKGKIPTTRIDSVMRRFWIDKKYNVLLVGRHGVGKTLGTLKEWEELGWKEGADYKYLSAPTLDPWVDLVGIPTAENSSINGAQFLTLLALKEKVDKGEITLQEASLQLNVNNGKSIVFIQPKWIKTVRALFLDEINRSHPKVRNALMEMIQFRSINGQKLPNLEFVWAAANPPDDEEFKYDVEELDPATEDRFDIQVYLPYEPDYEWFAREFGDSDLAAEIISWWKRQNESVRNSISPRRLAKAVHYLQENGDIRHIIPQAIAYGASYKEFANIVKFLYLIRKEYKDILSSKDEKKAWLFINDDNKYQAVIDTILKDKGAMHFFIPLMPKEKISLLFANSYPAQEIIYEDATKFPVYKDILLNIANLANDTFTRNKIYTIYGLEIKKEETPTTQGVNPINANAQVYRGSGYMKVEDFRSNIDDLYKFVQHLPNTANMTVERQHIFRRFVNSIPGDSVGPEVAKSALSFLGRIIFANSHVKVLAAKSKYGHPYEYLPEVINRFVKEIFVVPDIPFTMSAFSNISCKMREYLGYGDIRGRFLINN